MMKYIILIVLFLVGCYGGGGYYPMVRQPIQAPSPVIAPTNETGTTYIWNKEGWQGTYHRGVDSQGNPSSVGTYYPARGSKITTCTYMGKYVTCW